MNPEVPYIVLCPHCGDSIIIEQINCRIFRHAVYKTTGEQMDPHICKEVCEKARMDGVIYGCARPFLLDVPLCVNIRKMS